MTATVDAIAEEITCRIEFPELALAKFGALTPGRTHLVEAVVKAGGPGRCDVPSVIARELGVMRAVHDLRLDGVTVEDVRLAALEVSQALADRHAGQDACLAAGSTGHRYDRGRVEQAVSALAGSGDSFTADGVHKLVLQDDPAPYCRNLVSSVLGTWSRDGRIVEDRSLAPIASANRSRRASRNRWWRGCAIEGDA